VTDPWLIAARRVRVIGSSVCHVATKAAIAVAAAGVARAVWALVDWILTKAGQS
jgi:hypothetical protein